MLLHIVNQSPSRNDALASCLRHAQPGAGVLLIEDGVYGALRGGEIAGALTQVLSHLAIYALAPDVAARGLSDRLIDGIRLVDYDGFVDLVERHTAVQSWL